MVFELTKQYDNNIINWITNILLIFAILFTSNILYNEYKYEKHNKKKFINNCQDFEENLDKYKNSKLFNYYINCSDCDKKFIDDYITYIGLKYKNEKPIFNKKIKKMKSQLIYTSCVSFLFSTSITGLLSVLQ